MAVLSKQLRGTWISLIVTFVLSSCGLLHAQQVYPVWVTPMPAMFSAATIYLGDFAHIEATAGRLNYMIELRDPVELTRQVHFRLHVERNGTTVMMTDPALLPPLLTLQKNQPIMINGTDLAFYFDLNHLVGVSGFELNNVLPEDYYSICIEVIDFLRQEPISEKKCVSGFLNQLSPPILYMPQTGISISYGQSISMMFHWQLTGISLLFQSNIRYEFQLRELTEGLENSQDAFESHNLIFDQPDIYNYSLVYDAGMPPLVKGKTYVWRVRAYARDYNGLEIPGYFHNNGFSEIWQFKVPEDPGPDVETCNPRPTKTVQNRVPLRQLSVGDEIHIGHFDMTITGCENCLGENASGKGKIVIPFMDIDMEVQFDNLSINERKEAYAGQVNVVQADVLHSKLKANADGTINFAEPNPLTEAEARMILDDLQEDNTSQSYSLPYSLKDKLKVLFNVDMPHDLIVSEMWFTPEGAKFNAIMLVPDGFGGYARFGASNIAIDNAGLDFRDLHLFLAENTVMPGFDKQPVIVLAKGNEIAPELGSYIAFNCEGFKAFNLQGRYEFDKERLVRASNPSLPASATFTINTPTWGDFMATATIPDFAVHGMDDWRFHVMNAVADFSDLESKDREEMLGELDSLDKTWKGFYIRDLSVTLPQDLKFGTERALSMATKNLVIDSLGVNGKLKGQNLLVLGNGHAGGWGLSFEELQLNIVNDSFTDAPIKGKIIPAPLGDTITYHGKIFIDHDTKLYALDLIPMGAIDLPYMQGGFDFKDGSVVSIRKEMPFCESEWTPYADLNVNLNMTMQEADFVKLGGPGMSDIMTEVKTGMGSADEFTFEVSDLSIESFKINHPGLPAGKEFGFDDTSLSDGSITLAGMHMSMGGFDLLEEEFELDGRKRGLGMGYHLNLGNYSIISKFWALDNGEDAFTPFSLAKIEIDFPKVPKVAFNCECTSPESGSNLPDYCKPPVPPETTVSLEVGSKVEIGHFKMEVVTLSGKSGKGKIAIPFLGSEMEVTFSDLQIDPHGLMTAGIVQSVINPSFSDIAEDAMQATPGPMHLKKLKDGRAFLEKMNAHMEGMGDVLTCPYAVDDIVNDLNHPVPAGQFDFLLMGIHFGADSARLNSLIMFETPEGKYLKFGIAGIPFRPDGFDLKNLNLYLDEEVMVPAYRNEEIRLLVSKEGDPGSGSFIRYDCDGFKDFNLQAVYPINKSVVVNPTNSSVSAEAFLTITTPTWGNFTATAHMTPFTIPELDGWTFEPVEAGADFASDRNLENTLFPGAYRTAGIDWKGLYIKSLNVSLPKDVKLGNKKSLAMTTENLVMDEWGVTGELTGYDLLSPQDARANGVILSLKELQLNIQKNHFEDAYIKGDAVFVPWLRPMRYEGIIYNEPATAGIPHSFYAIDIIPVDNYKTDFFNINFSVGAGSGIAFRKRPKLDSDGHPKRVNTRPVYTYRRFAQFNVHGMMDIPASYLERALHRMGLGYVSGGLHLLGVAEMGYHAEAGIKNLRIHHPALPPDIIIGIEKYRVTGRLKTSALQ